MGLFTQRWAAKYVKTSVYQTKTGRNLQEVKHDLQKQLSDKELIIGDSKREMFGKLES